jgi:hypothetical protein
MFTLFNMAVGSWVMKSSVMHRLAGIDGSVSAIVEEKQLVGF